MLSTFLIAVAVLCGICTVLSVLLVLADGYLNDYGVCKISINDGERVLETSGGESLLGVLGREKIFIPSACGGRGSCGLCKLTITEGGGPILPTEEPHLTAAEIKENVRLSCQVKVRGDMSLKIPEELFSIREYEATVETIEDLTYDIKRVRFALGSEDTISVVPGQYIQLECPPYALTPEAVYRAYSIATDPADTKHIETLIRLVPNGICTTWVFEYLKQGDRVKLNGPYGDFRVQDTAAEMIFIAGGSGMAPFCSILAAMKAAKSPRKTRYFFGARAVRDLFYVDMMKQFESDLPDFKFIPALSEPLPADNWEGETGLITEVVGRNYSDCSDKEAYLCGSPGMIDACIRVLTERGMPEANIHYDKFA